jgi:hypothetical protein
MLTVYQYRGWSRIFDGGGSNVLKGEKISVYMKAMCGTSPAWGSGKF